MGRFVAWRMRGSRRCACILRSLSTAACEGVQTVWAAPHGTTTGRINSLCAPYSPHCRAAAVLVLLLTCGVVGASKLPRAALPAVGIAMRTWHLLAAVWLSLLPWLLLTDPRARPGPDGHADGGGPRT